MNPELLVDDLELDEELPEEFDFDVDMFSPIEQGITSLPEGLAQLDPLSLPELQGMAPLQDLPIEVDLQAPLELLEGLDSLEELELLEPVAELALL